MKTIQEQILIISKSNIAEEDKKIIIHSLSNKEHSSKIEKLYKLFRVTDIVNRFWESLPED